MSSIIVTSLADPTDPGFVTLRDAIIFANANPGTTITFDASLSGTIALLTALPILSANGTIIQGPGASVITVARSAAPSFRIFQINNTAITVSISGLTVTNGGPNGNGAGILVGATSTGNLDSLIITANTTTATGGGIIINSAATCNLTYSVISNNTATSGGAAIANVGVLNMSYCTVANNVGTSGGAISNINQPVTQPISNIKYSTINNNSTVLATTGAGLDNDRGIMNVSNSTFTENPTGTGTRSIRNYDSLGSSLATITLINVTIHNTNNTETVTNVQGTVSLGNTVVDVLAGAGTYVNLGTGTNNYVGAGANLGALANNGGPVLPNGSPTLTMMPNPGSPLIDSIGDNTIVDSLTDQRDYFRIINAIVDVGSVEANSFPVCYSGESLVLVKNILSGEICEVKAKNITAKIHEVFDTETQTFVPIKYNIVTGPITRFMLVEKEILGENKPNEDFFITSGHKVVIDGKIMKASKIPGAKRVKVKPQLVYSICIDNKSPIRVNNMDVIAWGHEEWLHYSKKHNIRWMDNVINDEIKENI